MQLMIRGGQLVLPDRTAVGNLWIRNGLISRIELDATANNSSSKLNDDETETVTIDASGKYVLPGLIDLHCDAIEKEVQPRPGTLFPLDMAFMEFERKLPLHGITSMYHSLSLGVGLSLRGDHILTQLVELIRQYRCKRSMVHSLIHLRYEVSHLAGYPIVEQYVREGIIDYLSLMDHSPGQGQYREEGSFERYVMKNQGVDVYEVKAIVDELNERRAQVDWEKLHKLGELAAARGIAVSSHDDDSPKRAEQSRQLGSTISEFPITLETAQYAAEQGMYVCVGAPNVVRGGSHDRNLRAADAITAGAAHILCSDYHPSSLLTAIFKLSDEGILPLWQAAAMASLNAAKAARIDHYCGSLTEGKAADLIIVDRYEQHPWVKHTLVNGKIVYTSDTI
ncbi:alpha-D-ribose 1-methylphosphonate 5-triphosphate diphosphatase [Paenibacillus solisilvae]|uniref:Alpha-D-ribose 1-methylphosphonate 5-triphosphate diphosphatase n=1 Tax=Paenibacillus solisilvae TaxID=2486751 RepID=A0ABW0W666_9BACL